MVDFPLSAMANAGLKNISVVAHHNYESLIEHIGSGADWGIPTDKGGVKIISPYMTAYAKNNGESYNSRLESLKSICNVVERIKEKYIVMSDCDCVFFADISKMLEFHVESRADITVCTTKKLVSDSDGRITEIDQSPSFAFDLNVNLWIFNRDYLVGCIKNAISREYADFSSDIIGKRLADIRCFEYRFEDEFFRVKSLADYFRINMKLLADDSLRGKISKNIKSRNSRHSSVRMGNYAKVSNSLISDGCHIDGTVENCIVFDGVTVGKEAVVKNSILLSEVNISEYAHLDFVIADRNVDVREGNILVGCKMLPYFIAKDKII